MSVQDSNSHKSNLLEAVRDSTRMKVVVTLAVVLVGHFGVCQPFNTAIARTTRLLREEERRWQLAQDIELLEAHEAHFQPRVVVGWDVNQWVQYVLDGVRARPLLLKDLDSGEKYKVGPYTAIELQLQVSGSARDVDSLLFWLETNERLFRIDALKLEPVRGDAPVSSLRRLPSWHYRLEIDDEVRSYTRPNCRRTGLRRMELLAGLKCGSLSGE